MPVTDFSFVHIIGFGYIMTLQVTFPILIPEDIFNLYFFCVRLMEILVELGDL